ncbi:MAG: outer membrane beta-barrel protein [Ferruginibacter sp.]|nr:outer membrane beta-barrel protein [Ferruginibacter sp.]
MRIKIVLFVFTAFFLTSLVSSAQSLTGKISDTASRKEIANAVVALITPGDSILYKFTRTGADGNFEISDAKAGNYILMVTHPYFAEYMDDIKISASGTRLNNLTLISKSQLLQEVIVKSGSPIKIKGDTVSYTADSFKVSANANVEELLRKLPGIQVDKNGQIKAMGETVEKVLVDGEEFFGDDPGMAVKNLRADAVKEVQVFDKKSDQAEFTGIDDGQTKKTINLKLKDDKKKGYFGKIETAGGLQKKIDDRYNTNLLFNAFKGKRKIAGFLLRGNTGQSGLDWQDQQKYGGNDDMTMGMDEDGGGFVMFSRGGDEDPYIDTRNGLFENTNAGLQYSNKWNDKHTLNFSPKFNQQRYSNNKYSFSQFQLNPDTVFNDNAAENTYANKRNIKNSLTYDLKIDSASSIKIVTKLNIYNTDTRVSRQSENTNIDGVVNNNSNNVTDNNTDKTVFSNSILFKHKFKKDRRTFSINTDFNSLSSKNTGYLNAVNNYYNAGVLNRTDSIDQKKNNDNLNKKLSARAVYTEPLSKKYSLELNYELSWAKADNELVTLSKTIATNNKYDQLVDSLSNNFDQAITTNKAGLKISFKHKKIKYSFGSAAGFTKFDLKDITLNKTYVRNFTNLFPAGNFQYTYKANHNLSVGYNGRTIQPSLNQLQQLRNNNNPLSEYIGNPLLKQSFRHNISLNHNSYNFLKELYTYQSLNLNITDNAITNSVVIEPTGKRITKPVNMDGNISGGGYLGAGKKLKKLDLNMNLNVQFNYGKFKELVNNKINSNENSNASIGLGLNKSKAKLYDFGIQNDFGYNVNKSTANNKTIKYNTNSVNLNATWYIKKVWKINSDIEFNSRQKTDDFPANVNNKLWNAQLEKTFHKDEFTLFFTIKDILNQNIGIDRNIYGNTLTEIRNDRLRRYWMLGFRWDFKNKNAAVK